MAFCDIRDKDFEADCRQFLNFVNSFHGDQRRVYTFPCLRAFLDSSELFPPKDNKLEKFWIDFNLSSGCVSFFVDEPEGFLWGSIHLLREEVDHYSLQLKHDERCGTHTVLSVRLNNPIMHHNSRGQAVELSFDSDHHRDLEEAAGRVFTTVRTSSPHVAEPSGSGKMSKHNGQFYSRKKSQIKSVLKILPLSSPSSEEDSCVMKRLDRSTAELQFDQIRDSTPTYESGVPVGAGTRILLEKGGSISPLRKEVSSGRKRAAADSGYLSDTPEGEPVHKQRVEPLREEEESVLQLAEGLPEGAGNPPGEKEGLIKDSAIEVPVVSGLEPKSDLTSGITAAFNNFKTQLEDQFTVCWQTVESEVLLSLKECQQHVSSLLTAVHQHRLVLLQTFENNVTDQLKRLQQNSSSLNSMNTQILSFFQIEMQRLGSFCEDHLQRLRSLQSEESTSQQPSSH